MAEVDLQVIPMTRMLECNRKKDESIDQKENYSELVMEACKSGREPSADTEAL